MSDGKKYQLTPIELVQWAEPLFCENEVKGVSEEVIASYEAAAGFRLPEELRKFYLACGEAELCGVLHRVFLPHPEADLFGGDYLGFSYDYIADEMDSQEPEDDYEELAQLRALPRERWDEVIGDYLLFWCENQGCWYAGIRREDLNQPDPPVYFNDEDTMFHWAPFEESVQSCILSILLEAVYEAGAERRTTKDPEEIRAILEKNGVDFQRLQEPYPFPGGRFAHTCLDEENNRLYVYSEPREDRPASLTVFMPWSEDMEED